MNKFVAIDHLSRDPEVYYLPPWLSLFYRLPKLPKYPLVPCSPLTNQA